MGIYGNLTYSVQSSLLEQYIDNSFLEAVLGPSADIKKKIKALKDKENITESDIKEIYKEIESVENKKEKQELYTGLATFLVGFITVYVGTFLTGTAPLPTSIIMTIAGLSMMFGGTSVTDKTIDKFYYDLLKIEAKVKKAKDKAEKLDDKDKVEGCQKIIDACEKFKTKRRQSLRSKAVGESLFVEEDVDFLLEYKGNDVKNNIFIQVLNDVDDICKMNMDKISTCEDTVSKLMTLGKQCNKRNANDSLVKARNIGRQTNEEISKITKDYYGPLTFELIKSEVKKFNNKYGSISMQEKKKLADKLNKYKQKLKNIGEKYSTNNKSYVKEWMDIADDIESYNTNVSREFIDLASSWLDMIVNEVNATLDDINYILYLLDIEKTEKSIIYKVLNFKSR